MWTHLVGNLWRQKTAKGEFEERCETVEKCQQGVYLSILPMKQNTHASSFSDTHSQEEKYTCKNVQKYIIYKYIHTYIYSWVRSREGDSTKVSCWYGINLHQHEYVYKGRYYTYLFAWNAVWNWGFTFVSHFLHASFAFYNYSCLHYLSTHTHTSTQIYR